MAKIMLKGVDYSAPSLSSSASAEKLNTDAGSATQPVYFKNGIPRECSYPLIKTGYTSMGKNYKLQTDSNGNGYVNVPWTDTTYTSLKNPHAITFSGNVTGTYDGSSAKTVAIPKYSSTVLFSGSTSISGSGSITLSSSVSDYFMLEVQTNVETFLVPKTANLPYKAYFTKSDSIKSSTSISGLSLYAEGSVIHFFNAGITIFNHTSPSSDNLTVNITSVDVNPKSNITIHAIYGHKIS